MADKITFEDKEKVRDSVLPTKNKGTADDFNEIKAVVNSHADDIDSKQDTLVSGTNIKTVNGATLLGSGDMTTPDTYLATDNQPIPDATNREVTLGAGSTLLVGGVKHFEDGKSSRLALDSYISDGNLLPSHITEMITNTKLIEPRFNNGGTFKDIVYKAWLKLSTVDRTNLEATYTGADSGIVNYDFDLNKLFLFNGTVSREILTKNGNGLIAVNDSNGIPVYFDSLASAYSSAVSGQVVYLLGNYTETSDVEIVLKNGVTIDLNGYTYTLNTTGNSDCFSAFNTVGVSSYAIVNGNVTKIGGGTGLILNANRTSDFFKLTNVTFDNKVGGCYDIDGTVNAVGSYFYGNTAGIACSLGSSSSYMIGGRNYNLGSGYNNCSGTIENSHWEAISSLGCYLFGTAINCTFKSVSNDGVLGSGATIYGGKAISTSGTGADLVNSSKAYNFIAESLSGTAINLLSGNGELHDCIGKSTTGRGIAVNSSGLVINNCESIGVISPLISTSCKVYNFTSTILSGTANGVTIGANTELIKAVIRVADPTAYGVSSVNVDSYVRNVDIKGTTLTINYGTGSNLWTAVTDSANNSAQL